jgi:hypothetical protein
VIHNAIKYSSPLLRAYSRVVGLGEDEEGTVRLGETLTPVLDIWSLPEWAFNRGELIGVTRVTKAAVAGEFSIIGILCPSAARRRLVVVEKAGVVSTVAGGCILELCTEAQLNALTAAAQTVGSSRDRRAGADSATQTISGSAVAQTTGGRVIDAALSTTGGTAGPFEFGLPVILPPGFALAIVGRAANELIIATFAYREREAFPGEL